MRHLLLLPLVVLLSFSLHGQSYYYGDTLTLNPDIASPEEFLGYPVGSLHTRHDQIVSYFRYLAEASDRAELDVIGQTYEYRQLVVLNITSAKNVQNLEKIRARQVMLTQPDKNVETGDMPAVVLLGYNVHGNEPSGSEAALLTAYYYCAVENEAVKEQLQNAILLIDPTFNPDGRDRHTTWVNAHKAEPLVADPNDREHNEAWPGGRTNHYWFDLNRDWFPLVHPESKARVAFYHQWYPHVVTDYHEMGTNSTYFFEPTEPFGSENPVVPRSNYDKLNNLFATYFHQAMDRIGSLYFTGEVYDNSYPGYGSTYPDIHGGLGLVFEQASSRGHLQDSRMGPVSFPFTIRNHFTTSLATVTAAVENRQTLHDHMQSFFQSAVDEAANSSVKGYIFSSKDHGRLSDFHQLLEQHQIEVLQVNEDISVEGKQYPASSSYFVPTLQPQYRMVRSVFEKVTDFYDSVFYDASTWNAALSYGVKYSPLKKVPETAAIGQNNEGDLTIPEIADYAYLIDWTDSRAVKALNSLLQQHLYVNVAFQPFTHKGKEYGYGTLIVPVGRQNVARDVLYDRIKQAALGCQCKIESVQSGLTAAGPDLGSNQMQTIPMPKVIMPVGNGFSSYEAGEVWHALDQRVGLPVTKVDITDFNRISLDSYSVMILPSLYGQVFSSEKVEEIKKWVRNGNTLITIREASAWAIDQNLVDLTKKEQKTEQKAARRDYRWQSEDRGAQQIGGSIYAADLDITHPIGFGFTDRDISVYRNHENFINPSSDPYQTVVQYAGKPLLSGYIHPEQLEMIPNSSSVVSVPSGKGQVILFIDNPNFRGMWPGTSRLFFNAVFFGSLVR